MQSHAISSPIDVSVLIPVFQSRQSLCIQNFVFVGVYVVLWTFVHYHYILRVIKNYSKVQVIISELQICLAEALPLCDVNNDEYRLLEEWLLRKAYCDTTFRREDYTYSFRKWCILYTGGIFKRLQTLLFTTSRVKVQQQLEIVYLQFLWIHF